MNMGYFPSRNHSKKRPYIIHISLNGKPLCGEIGNEYKDVPPSNHLYNSLKVNCGSCIRKRIDKK